MADREPENILHMAARQVKDGTYTGPLLTSMVRRGLLTNEQAVQVIEEALATLPEDDSFRAVFLELKKQFS